MMVLRMKKKPSETKKYKKNGKTKKSKESENGSENPEQEEVKEANHAAAARPADEGSNEGDVKRNLHKVEVNKILKLLMALNK